MKMKKSLSTRLMYNFMTVIVIGVVSITAGISYLIAEYFFQVKEQELIDKGREMGKTVEAFVHRDGKEDKELLYRYIVTVDNLVGAHVWLFNDNYELVAASQYVHKSDVTDRDALKNFLKYGVPSADDLRKNVDKLDEGIYNVKISSVLHDIYAGKSYKSQLFHPGYKEQVIIVGVPYETNSGRTGAILMIESLSSIERFLRNVYIYIILVGIFSLICSMFMVKRLSSVIIRPVLEMKDNATAMAAGDYSKKVVVQGQDEIAELGNALNSLGDDLSAYITKMERTEKIRRDFVANVSHELRTPITIIRGYNEAIGDGIVTDAETLRKYHEMINDETVRLERMVRELLDISKLEATDVIPATCMEPLPLSILVRNVAEKLSVKAAKQNVKFAINVDETLEIFGDGDKIIQLILILADNALKYSPENGTVLVGTKKHEDGGIILFITDEGKGIPAEDIPFIWERFYKVEKSHCRNVPGTGLGLAIAKEIIRVHGASAQVFSECGHGTTFEIKFPKDKIV